MHPDFTPQIANALLDGQGASPSGVSGRGQLSRVKTPKGEVLIRKYLRGGLVAGFLKDAYLLDNRPLKELRAHRHAWCAGVPTVMPIGARWDRSGLFYRGAYATLRADAVDLLAYLQAKQNPAPTILDACGRAIRAMHDAGVYHADLQVKNLLVSGGEALIIDFDGARILPALSPAMAEKNLARLRRSFVKRGLSLAAFDSVYNAYGRTAEPKSIQHRGTENTE